MTHRIGSLGLLLLTLLQISTASVSVFSANILENITTPWPGLQANRLVLHCIGESTPLGLPLWQDHNSGIVRIMRQDNSSAVVVTNISVLQDKPMFWITGITSGGQTLLPQFPIEVDTYVDVHVRFNEEEGPKGLRTASLVVQTTEGNYSISLVGLFNNRRANEPTLQQVIDAMGFKINTYNKSHHNDRVMSDSVTSPLIGEEIRTREFTATQLPIQVAVLASFIDTTTLPPIRISLGEEDSPYHLLVHPQTTQTLFPRSFDTDGPAIAQFSYPTDRAFPIVVKMGDNVYTSADWKRLQFRFFPLRDQRGYWYPNNYLVAHDVGKELCGSNLEADCDYNDNIFIIANAQPTIEPFPPTFPLTDNRLTVKFDGSVNDSIIDVNGVPTGFFGTLTSDLDIYSGYHSLAPRKLHVDTSASILYIDPSKGDVLGPLNSLVNCLVVAFDPIQHSYRDPITRQTVFISSGFTVRGQLLVHSLGPNVTAGIILGSNKDTFARISVSRSFTALTISVSTELDARPTTIRSQVFQNEMYRVPPLIDLAISCSSSSSFSTPVLTFRAEIASEGVFTHSVTIPEPYQGFFVGYAVRAGLFAFKTSTEPSVSVGFSRFVVEQE